MGLRMVALGLLIAAIFCVQGCFCCGPWHRRCCYHDATANGPILLDNQQAGLGAAKGRP
jgi:hypothetical protein